jgi:hypothetical protein
MYKGGRLPTKHSLCQNKIPANSSHSNVFFRLVESEPLRLLYACSQLEFSRLFTLLATSVQ